MMDWDLSLKVLIPLLWLANGIIRMKLYSDWGDWLDFLVAAFSFIFSALYGASAYMYFIGL